MIEAPTLQHPAAMRRRLVLTLPAFLIVTLASLGCDMNEQREVAEADDNWDDLPGAGKADGIGSNSYGALAATTVPVLFAELTDGLSIFDENILPHEAKELRKQIGKVRDFVDLFVFAYDPDDPKGDLWRDLREDLDDGYEAMGAFKDVFDAQGVEPEEAEYDLEEVDELRTEVLEWKAKFEDHEAEYADYLAHPSLKKLHDRKSKHLPRFYWREADLEPDKDLSGLENMARLTRELIEQSRDDLEDMEDLDKLHKTDNQIPFHDFRKRLRSVEKLAGYFPQIFESDEDPAALLATVELAVDHYGDINDRLIAYERAKEADDDDAKDELKDLIADMWDVLQGWQEDVDLDDVLRDLRKTIHKVG